MITVDLSGRRALVTGASGGLGRAMAEMLAQAGAQIAVHYCKGQAQAEAVVQTITSQGGKAQAFAADLSDPAAVTTLMQQASAALGGLDILVNNAGFDGQRAPVGEDDPAHWQKVLAVDLLGPYYCARAVLPHMIKARRGVIINITSVHEFIPWEGYSAYTSAKAGLSMFTKTLAQETADKAIRVVAIAPGAIQTPINEAVWNDPNALKDLDDKISMGRLGTPTEIASVVTFLASDLASYITGTTIAVDGGMLIYPEFRHGG
ncbi:glucose dehydrogenase [Acidiferrobacter sp. SPIII_3]|jgi:glucose 1-dehydrogenase|uniref:3-oxoacyl-ACP reductase FabG n=1 Tax=Acidiferrobacter sp. SPIII_3 TaxID=1281578 RepID=UPI000D738524|nr:3-oxoacyl-ACP reductase FabG [Acidiferrobacter sp. SPIII_3]AWP23588.1 glucose dehydrogenase [Acidiferrobacter sp. SPIII_3]MDA8190603.1 3-oxoacyl-ACP reductase FabG [Gammaproteobacteria bacterium]